MTLLDLLKATLVCGLLAFLCYNWPVIGQAVVIGALTLVWLSYAYRVMSRLLRR